MGPHRGSGRANEGTMSDLWNPALTPQDEAAIAAFMNRLAAAPPRHDLALPEAELVWLKAQLLRRWDAERRAEIPLDIMEPVQIAGGLAVAGLLMTWSLRRVDRTLPAIAISLLGI